MRRIRLTEEDLHMIIRETVEEILSDNEVDNNDLDEYDRYQPYAPELDEE